MWKEQFVKSTMNEDEIDFPMYEEFLQLFKSAFKEVFPVPHGFQCFSSGIPVLFQWNSSAFPVEFQWNPVDFHWKSTGHLNSHKPNKFIRLSSKSPLDFHWTSTGSPLDSTIFHWTFVPVLFQWTPVDSSGIPVESSGIPVEFTGICSTVFK